MKSSDENFNRLYELLVDTLAKLYTDHNQDPSRVAILAAKTCKRKILCEHISRGGKDSKNVYLFINTINLFTELYPGSLLLKDGFSINQWKVGCNIPSPPTRISVYKLLETFIK